MLKAFKKGMSRTHLILTVDKILSTRKLVLMGDEIRVFQIAYSMHQGFKVFIEQGIKPSNPELENILRHLFYIS